MSASRTMVRYQVRPETAEENVRQIAGVLAALRRVAPSGLRYEVQRAEDGVSFVHLVAYDSPAAHDALRTLPEFRAFTAAVRARCVEGPTPVRLEEVARYDG